MSEPTSNSDSPFYGYATVGDDEFEPSPNGGDMDYDTRPWEKSDWFDLVVSGVGFYVATLGLKATTENTLVLASAYFAVSHFNVTQYTK